MFIDHVVTSKNFIQDSQAAIKLLEESGYTVNYARCPILGFDFSIGSLFELSDGIRLARIAEIISGDHSFQVTSKLNLKPLSYTQKCLNMAPAVQSLQKAGVLLSEATRDSRLLSRGSPEVMVQVLWETLIYGELPFLIDEESLRQEIAEISTSYLEEQEGATKQEVLISLLLEWSKAICAKHMEVRDFSASFADGKAFCYIFHHYHPELVPLKSIKETTFDLFRNMQRVCR